MKVPVRLTVNAGDPTFNEVQADVGSFDGAPLWRHSGAMAPDSKTATVRTLDRINSRLSGETFDAIDAARGARSGNISRNAWIAEADEQKLARDRAASGQGKCGADHA
jgi:hypothetical protein